MKRMALLLTLLTLLGASWALSDSGEEREKIELKPALLVVDIQNEWMPLMADEDKDSAPELINKTIALFREFGYPIINVYHTDPQRGPEPGTEAFAFDSGIEISADDETVVKNRASAFTNTGLEEVLRNKDRNLVFLCGLSATGCVLATYYGAMDRDFRAVMVQGALMSRDASKTKVIEEICYSATLEEVKQILENPFL